MLDAELERRVGKEPSRSAFLAQVLVNPRRLVRCLCLLFQGWGWLHT